MSRFLGFLLVFQPYIKFFCSCFAEESAEKGKGQERKVKRDMILMTLIVRRNLQRTKVSDVSI